MLCNICFNPLHSRDPVSTAKCGHFLHQSCWTTWLEKSKTCPVCRQPTTSQQLLQLYFTGECDDALTLYIKTIETLKSQVSVLEQEKTVAEKMLFSEQTEKISLRKELERSKDKAKIAQKNLDSLERKLDKERNDRKDVVSVRHQIQALLKYFKYFNNKKPDLRQVLVRKEVDKLRSQILSLKMGPTTTRINFDARKFQRSLEALDRSMNNLNQRLQQ